MIGALRVCFAVRPHVRIPFEMALRDHLLVYIPLYGGMPAASVPALYGKSGHGAHVRRRLHARKTVCKVTCCHACDACPAYAPQGKDGNLQKVRNSQK